MCRNFIPEASIFCNHFISRGTYLYLDLGLGSRAYVSMLRSHYFYQQGAASPTAGVLMTVNDERGRICAELQADSHRSAVVFRDCASES